MGNMNMSNTGMDNYVRASLETHLFFARIMKEHALFLLAAFPAVEMEYRKKADLLREELEKALADAVLLADHRLQDPFGDSAASGGSRAPGGESLSQTAGRRSTERSCRRKMLLMPLRYFQRKKLVVYLM